MKREREDRVYVGVVGRAHGIRGDVTVRPDSDNPNRFAAGSRLATASVEYPEIVVRTSRLSSKGGLIVAFEGILDRTRAESMRGVQLFIDRDQRRPLSEGEFWPDELIGLDVTVGGTRLGEVRAVNVDTAQPRLEIDIDGGDVAEVPFVEALVPVVDVPGGFIEIVQMDGLLTSS